MIKTSIELLAEPIGFDIANSDDVVQSNLLNGFGRGFQTYNEHQLGLQLSYIVNKLKPETEKIILELAEFIKLKNKK